MRSSRRDFQLFIGQHRTIPALRLKHRSDGCGTASALRFWLGICRTSLAVSALRIMRYCHRVIPPIILFRLFQLADQLVGTGCREA